ncbi:molybdopterin-dependent oxidoreductase [Nocardioides flavescens]|uniref:Molybdopterin-dependent oxidoreductase n=1 Tax=Nocardioides flavescens TaxID=2691959 RepID=A0A6L7F0K0_9ACTN|nr:molybdopterin-dependent oxidoreductase [Nocardioides flavescens]MXG90011.1 molybdopterin-dependent oxidoreductase [Nocardioides flavescens]
MRSSRGAWSLAGVVAGAAGLATSYVAAMLLTIRESPVVAVAELVIRITPGWLAEYLIGLVGQLDKPLLILGIFGFLALVCAWAGRLARRSWWLSVLVLAVLAAVGALAVSLQRGATATDGVPVVIGFVTWLAVLALLVAPLRRADENGHEAAADPAYDEAAGHARRTVLVRAGLIAAAAAVLGVAGRVVGRGRRHVEESRRLLRLPQVTEPAVPRGARTDLEGITPWATRNDRFYLIHTAIIVPTIEPADWSLRIHGAVDRELVLTYDDLLRREFTEQWVTLNCVSNPVGGDLIGNAWWSGVRLADLLEEAGVHADADAVLQTSHDGWTCGTPLEALTDDRGAMLAVAMNGVPLPIEHGFPVRTIVPGLYGYVSATKWVEDLEVTRFADISAYWTERGWGERGPVKMSSRVDVPRSGEQVEAGEVRFGGVAWAQGTGISAVEFAVDGGPWTRAELASVPNVDTWVQWTGSLDVEPGDHTVRVRAVDADGTVQDGTERDVLPDGATGWHTSDFTAS